jgi:hypothetical protein
MSKRTAASFALDYCRSEQEFSRVLFTAEQNALQLLATKPELLKAANRSDDAFAFKLLAGRFVAQSKLVQQEFLKAKGEAVPIFMRTPYDPEGTAVSASSYVWHHGMADYVEPAGNALAAKARALF